MVNQIKMTRFLEGTHSYLWKSNMALTSRRAANEHV